MYVARTESHYPYLLKQIPDPPKGLYYKGDYENFDWKRDRFLVVVGTRRPSAYGQMITTRWVSELAQLGIVIISGLALGVDALAHRAALKIGGRTIAVLGGGVDIIYPQANTELYQQILNHDGLILSEFPPGRFVEKNLFITRNRIVSGLAKAILVVEGTARSGTLITVRYALEQGREVLVVPGQVDTATAQAPLLLLKQGATLATSVQDIIESI